MGYYSHFKLTVKGPKKNKVYQEIVSDEDSMFYQAFESGERGKWYEHVADMVELSKQYPENLFILNREGEESGHLERKYFKNGKVQYAPEKISYERFNESKLRDYDPDED